MKKLELKNKKTIIMVVVVIILILLIGIIIVTKRGNSNIKKVNETIENKEQIAKIETGTKYNCNQDNTTGTITFDNDNDYTMEIIYDQIEGVTYKGTYKINENIITLTVTYNEYMEDMEQYTETIIILENGQLEYHSKNGFVYLFDKNITLAENTDNKTQEQKNETIDRHTFLANLTSEQKQIINDNIKTYVDLKETENFIEDRIVADDDELIYEYIYVYKEPLNRTAPVLKCEIYDIAIKKEIPKDIQTLKEKLGSSILVNKFTSVSAYFDEGTVAISDDDIKSTMPKLNKLIEDEIKNKKDIRDKYIEKADKNLKELARNCSLKILESYMPDGFSGDRSGDFEQYHKQYQVIDKNNLLYIMCPTKYTSNTQYNESGYTEILFIGVYMQLDKLPMSFTSISAEKLIELGYINVDENKDIVITPATKIMDSEKKTKEEYKQIYDEQYKYICEHLGINS